MSNILVVDDNTSILVFIEEALKDEHQVTTVTSVDEAETASKEIDFDILITDLVMPNKNGIDMIMEFKKSQPNMHILAISGGGGITGRFDYLPIAELIGAEKTLKKPFTAHELRKSVTTILAS